MPGVDVVVTNRATGISMHGALAGRRTILVSGLDVGGPYAVTVRRIGSRTDHADRILLSLGQTLQVDVSLEQQTVALARNGDAGGAECGSSRERTRAPSRCSPIR